MDAAIQEADATIRRAQTYCSKMARFLVGRLRKCHPLVLVNLKKELKDFNAVTLKWKNQ